MILKLCSKLPVYMLLMALAIALTACDSRNLESEEIAKDAVPASQLTKPSIYFEDESIARGVEFVCGTEMHDDHWMPEIMAGGGAAIDVDDDGWMDLYLIQATGSGGDRLLRNRGDGTFEDITAQAGTLASGFGFGAITGDVDRDGDQDLVITGLNADTLLLNEGGHFVDATAESGLGDTEWASSGSLFDADGDADLDLFICRYVQWSPEGVLPCLGIDATDMETAGYCKPNRYPPSTDLFYLNDGQGRFSLHTDASGIGSVEGYGLGVVAADYDMDGDQDLFVANDTMPDRLWRGNGDGTFVESGFEMACDRDNSGLAKAGMGVSVTDLDRDGLPDFVVCNLRGETDSLYLNRGGYFQDITTRAGLSTPSYQYTRFGLGLVDFDNDGFVDYFAANGAVLADPDAHQEDLYAHQNLLLRGRSDQIGFESVDGMGGLESLTPRTSRGAIFADFDNDGGMDIVVLNRDAPARLLMNRTEQRGHWLLLDVRDDVGAPAIGAVVDVVVGDVRHRDAVRTDSSYLSARDHRIHVGLGDAEQIDSMQVVWPDGRTRTFSNLEVNRVIRVDPPA
ncbi:MAG: CRTAC1 family protein [Phycisphaerales bacterium]|nr:CRTAC1 family protein [Phycisphaerales bacterium]